MVVLAAAVCTKVGKPLFSRQFVPMSKLRIESLLVAFPKLLGTDVQHTFIETENVRYIYQPLEQLYILLITNKSSNIMEDLETLRLLAKLVPEYCSGHAEQNVLDHAFELLFAFDEVISIGFKENVNLHSIKTFTEMDSHEEILQKIIMENKATEAKLNAVKKAEELDRIKAETRKRLDKGLAGGGTSSSMTGYGSDSMNSSSGGNAFGGGSGMGSGAGPWGGNTGSQIGSSGMGSSASSAGVAKAASAKPSGAAAKPAAGANIRAMQLGKAKKTTDDFVNQLAKEEKINPAQMGPAALAQMNAAVAAGVATPAMVPPPRGVKVELLEQLFVQLERDGGIKKFEIKGDFKLTVVDPDDGRIMIRLAEPLKKSDGFQCQLHPKCDKKAFDQDGQLCLKDRGNSFPIGSESAVTLFKWKKVTDDESALPFTITFWVDVDDGMSKVNVEITHAREEFVGTNIILSIPCKATEPPEVTQNSGEWSYHRGEGILTWLIPEISSSNTTATLDFQIPEVDQDTFYPVNIRFQSSNIYAPIQVVDVVDVSTEAAKELTIVSSLTAGSFQIE